MFENQPSDRTDCRLGYALVESSLGRLLVVMSRQGVVDVLLGESRARLLADAKKRFPGSILVPDHGAHGDWVAAVVTRIECARVTGVAPVDLDFERRRCAIAS